jgi:hypothetical protein
MQNVPIDPELYRQVFEVDRRGAAILDQLLGMFSKGAVTTGENAVLKTYKNLGNAEVVQYIVGQINRANGAEPLDNEIPD